MRKVFKRFWMAIVAIVLVVIIIITAIALGTADHSSAVAVDGTTVTAYEKAVNALNAQPTVTVSDDTEIVLSASTASLTRVNVTLTGQASGTSITASTGDPISIGALQLAEDGVTFTFDANEVFTENEIVLMQVDFNASVDSFGSDVTTRYYTFSVGPTERTDNDEDVSQTTDTESNDGLSAIVSFNGWNIPTYTDANDAIANANSLAIAKVTVTVTPGDRVRKVTIGTYRTDGNDLGDEWFIWSDKDWTVTMDFSQYSGQTIVVRVNLVSNDFAPELQYRYFAVTVASNLASEVEEVTVTEAETESASTSETFEGKEEGATIIIE